jgi:hypothetical protein
MDKLKITYLPFASLVPSVYNSNTHPEEQIQQIAKSIKEFGFNQPIAIGSKNNILAGEGRYYAAKLLGRREVPTICLAHLNEAQQRAYIIADNQIARNSIWDPVKLQNEISALMSMEVDISVLAFDNDQIMEILKDASALNNPLTTSTRAPKKSHKTVKEQREAKQLVILVYCDNKDHQAEILAQLEAAGVKCETTLI